MQLCTQNRLVKSNNITHCRESYDAVPMRWCVWQGAGPLSRGNTLCIAGLEAACMLLCPAMSGPARRMMRSPAPPLVAPAVVPLQDADVLFLAGWRRVRPQQGCGPLPPELAVMALPVSLGAAPLQRQIYGT